MDEPCLNHNLNTGLKYDIYKKTGNLNTGYLMMLGNYC